MAINVMSWVWRESKADGADLLVLLAIADQAHEDGDGAWPSIPTLAAKARVSDRTVQRCLNSLALLGELEVRKGAGRNGVNIYRVIMATECHPVRMSPRHRVGVTPRPKVVTPVSQSGDMGVTRTVLTSLTKRESLSPFCEKHQPNGTDTPCRNCGTARLAAEAAQREKPSVKSAAEKRAKNCQTCGGDGWILNREGKPMGKCPHPDKLASAR